MASKTEKKARGWLTSMESLFSRMGGLSNSLKLHQKAVIRRAERRSKQSKRKPQ